MRYFQCCRFAKKYPPSLRICETWIETWTVLHSLGRTTRRSRPLCLTPRAAAQGAWGAKRCQYGRETNVQIVHTLRTNKYAMKGFACDRLVELT